ncbi:MAG: arylesterase [Rhodothermales bacterium]|nr:arylesterase [Rhodothermales bacterium]MBO6781552.1 arylesterase [Rhodothermales bacterium]
MKKSLLYPLLAVVVLLTAACGSQAGENAPPEGSAASPTPTPRAQVAENSSGPRVLFFGDSITAGFGLREDQAFPALLDNRLDSLGIEAELVNAGLSGETTAAGLRRIDWVLQNHVDVLVLGLGGNDALRGVDLSSTRENLQGIVDKTRASNPEAVVVVAGMMIPPNFGPDYAREFAELFPELAQNNDAILIPFILDGVGGFDEYMLPDQIHPNEAGHRKVADLVEPYLLEALERVPQQAS